MKSLCFLLALLLASSLAHSAQYKIKPENSQLKWLGKKVTGQHEGTIKVKKGFVDFTKGQGSVEVDMTSIDVTDLEGDWKKKLDGLLRSDDFFSVKNHNTAKLKMNKIKFAGKAQYKVEGDLTIKGVTKPVSFTATRQNNKFKGFLTFDRTDFGIKYKSGKFFEDLGDKLIYDDVKLSFEVTLEDFKPMDKAKKKSK